MEVTLGSLKAWLKGFLRGEYMPQDEPPQSDDPDMQAIGELAQQVSKHLEELRDYALALARGNLDVDFPSRSNYLSGGLKELHANMLHLLWKVEQIARGNYSQQVDFMGQISEAFNQMAKMLAKRDLQLNQSQNILEIILSFADISLFVLEKENGALLQGREHLSNYSAVTDMPAATVELLRQLREHTASAQIGRSEEWQLYSKENNKWYMVYTMPGVWGNSKDAYFHVLTNISETIALNERLQNAMYHDAKFPVYNQIYALEYISGLMQSYSPFVICYFDLDNFKQINDQKGHDEGDRYILNFIDIVGGVIRAHDVFCRVGGDEFLLVLSGLSAKGAQRIINRLEEKTEEFNKQENSDIPLAFSYGIEMLSTEDYTREGIKSCEDKSCRDKECGSPQCIINRADHKMYEQKRGKGVAR
ncbi:MAG: GGDEF domain-containing protein [Clostridiales bacterium]|nr:GGDEF domain-containing protein [Clostridiales bacterium]